MKIKESKDIKYDKMPIEQESEYETIDPKVCILERFDRADDKLILYFRNRSLATIRAQNIKGGREIDQIEEWLGELVGKSYDDILNVPF